MQSIHFKRLEHPIKIEENERLALGYVYPYGMWHYRDIAESAKKFLGESFPHHKGYLQALGVTNHNGKGRQWGVILFKYPYDDSPWEIVAQFGHRPGGLRTRVWYIRKISRYFQYQARRFEQSRALDTVRA